VVEILEEKVLVMFMTVIHGGYDFVCNLISSIDAIDKDGTLYSSNLLL